MGKHDVRNILLGGGILLGLYFLFKGQWPSWPPPPPPPTNGGIPPTQPPSQAELPGGVTTYEYGGQTFTSYDEWHSYLHTIGLEPMRVYSQGYKGWRIEGIAVYRPPGGTPGPLLYWRILWMNSPWGYLEYYLYPDASAVQVIDYIVTLAGT